MSLLADSGFKPRRGLGRLAPLCLLGWLTAVSGAPTNPFFGIQCVDEVTGRGVPLVELETVNHLRLVSDSAGWVAFHEPGLMDQRVFFHVRSHGYEFPKDGFGQTGVALQTVPGTKTTLRLKRLNVAERLYRITGEGLYRDSVLLGEPTPLIEPLGSGKVAGQDSTFAVRYRGQVFWFWGDTSRMSYPLGHFWMAGATSALPGQGGLNPALGINLRYFVQADGFSRPMARLGVARGLMWLDGFLVLPDATGRERLVAHYAHMESLAKRLDHGLALYRDETEEFERGLELDLAESWRFPQGHPIRYREAGQEYFYFGEVFPHVRVRADFQSLTNPASYEAWTCLAEASSAPSQPSVSREAAGHVQWAWRRQAAPWTTDVEQRRVAAGDLQPEETRFSPVDVVTGKVVGLHRGSVRWNAYRKRWVLIAVQSGGTSALGEVWYAEAPEPTGPWRRARKIVSHDRYSFYNPVHHDFFDQAEGRLLYFEGTYVNTFSGNADATPRYDYNQVMYRLDQGDPRLEPAQK